MRSSRLRIRLLGPLEVWDENDRLDLPPSKKARALLAYLVTTGRPHSRSALCDLFWQDVHDPRAGLRWALSKLRTALDTGGGQLIVTDRDLAGVELDAVEVDLMRVRADVSDDPTTAPTEALQRAADSFRGEFVDGLELPGCHQYEAWCLGTRQRLRSLRISIHRTLAERLHSDPESALSHALNRLALDPFTEEAYVAAIERMAAVGRADSAMELYDRCRRMLADTTGGPPSNALLSARRRIRTSPRSRPATGEVRASDDPGGDDLAKALAGLPEPEHLPAPRVGDPPLVGRATEVEALTRIIERSASGAAGQAVLLTGEAGIGKTRLLRETVRTIRSAGGWALASPVFETESFRPYGPWSDMLRQVPDAALDRETRRGLAGLLQGGEPDRPPGGPTERSQLFEAAAGLLRRMALARAPGLVALDDVQWLDASSSALLHYLVRILASTPLVFAMAARDEEIGSASEVARMLRSLDEGDRWVRIPLGRLDASHTRTLVHAVDTGLDPVPVFAASEGNPLFTLAIAGSYREGVHRIPASIEEELHDRLERLEPNARSLLPWAAALGRAFDLPTLMRVVERPAHEVVDAIATLERRGVLRATGADRYDFAHSLLRQAAYDRPSEPLRRQIHRSIATALDTMGDGRMPGAVAHHAELGGLTALSAEAYADAGEACLWVFAFDEAAMLVERGLAQLAALPDKARIPLEMNLLRIYSFGSMRDRRPADIEDRVHRVTEAARRQGMIQIVARGHAVLMELQYQRGAYDQAGQSSLRSAEAGREAEPDTAARTLAETAVCLLLLDQAPDDAARLASEAAELTDQHGVEVAAVTLARALLHQHEGESENALLSFQEVVRLGKRQNDRWWELPALTRMVMAQLDQGDLGGARAHAREAQELAERLDDEVEAAFARGLGAVATEKAREGFDRRPDNSGDRTGVDAALEELRALDSLWRIAQVQAYAAEVDLQRGRVDAARQRADEALGSARTLQRPSLLALARALLAECAALEGDRDGAQRHLDRPEITRPDHRLSHRARQGIERARAATLRV